MLRLLASTIPESYTGVPFMDQTVQTLTLGKIASLAPVVQTMDSAVQRINHYPVDSAIQRLNNWSLEFIIHILSRITGVSHGPGIQNGHPTRI